LGARKRAFNRRCAAGVFNELRAGRRNQKRNSKIMETDDDLHNRLTREHFAWFDKVCASKEEPIEPKDPFTDPLFQDSNGEHCTIKREVWEWYAAGHWKYDPSEYHGYWKQKRDLESISWQEVLEDKAIIRLDRYREIKKNGNLIFPFKKN
jgi:hypothetical protein